MAVKRSWETVEYQADMIPMEKRDKVPVDNLPAAFVFGNGNVIVFDKNGVQDVDIQSHGLSGLHIFAERYPDQPVYFAAWNAGIDNTIRIHGLKYFLEQIKKPPEEKTS